MAELPFFRDRSAAASAEGPVGALKPFRESNEQGKSAPGGDFFSESELPVYAISDQAAGAFKIGPVNYSPENPPLPDDPMKGYTYPPGEGRR